MVHIVTTLFKGLYIYNLEHHNYLCLYDISDWKLAQKNDPNLRHQVMHHPVYTYTMVYYLT